MRVVERHLYSRNGKLYYRCGLPKILKPFLPFQEIVLSLGTSDIAHARLYVAKLDIEVERLIQDVYCILDSSPNEEGLHKLKDRVAGSNDKLREAVGLANIRHSPHWYSSLQSLSKGGAGKLHSRLFSKISKQYIEDCLSNGDRTKNHKAYVFDLFVQLVGDVPISQITRDEARRFKAMLLKMPSNLSKHNGIDISKIDFDNLPNGKPQSHNTINGKLISLLSLFEWAIQNELYEGLNPFRALLIKDVKVKKKQTYTQDDLDILFSSPLYTGCAGESVSERLKRGDRVIKDYLYWVPVIALYSGMRLNEICQLERSDIACHDSVWCFDVNDDGNKKLKTASSKRKVPVHSELIKLGLLDYVETIEQGRIFEELELGRDGSYSYMFTKRYSRLLKGLELKREGLCFHSFRHTFIDSLRNSGVERSVSMALVGHGSKSDIHSNYGHGYRLDTLRENIEKVSFDLPLKSL